ncbi:MAG: CopD family protein [Bacteroidetes bacterium]|nr:CopD family protein [Bacteroidota bacterium]
MEYQVIKALHLIFVVSWFAGLFYMVRLFIYHVEALKEEEFKKAILIDQYQKMQRRLWWIITTPAMVLTLFFGIWMLVLNPRLLKFGWMHLKLGFVVLLLIYHVCSHLIMYRLASGHHRLSSIKLRIWNEVATLFLVAIIFVVVLKSNLSWIYGTIGFFVVGIFLMLAVKAYQKLRK